jgi:hypothetical protein
MGTVGRVYTVYLSAISAEFINPVFAGKPKTLGFKIENERFGLVFAKTVSMNSGTAEWTGRLCPYQVPSTSSMDEQGAFLSTTSSMDMQGVTCIKA